MLRIPKFLIALIASAAISTSLTSAEETLSLPGTWTATGDLPTGGSNESTITITKEGDTFKGVAVGEDEEERELVRFSTEGKKVSFEVDVESNGETGVLKIKAEQTEIGKLAGEWALFDSSGEERAKELWKAIRTSEPETASPSPTASFEGKWNSVATTEDGEEHPAVVELAKDGDKYAGSSTSDRGKTKFDVVDVSGKDLEIEMVMDFDGTELDVRIEAAQKDEDHLEGKWVIFDNSGQEAATGDWTAERALVLDLTGTWDGVATTDEGENTHQATFEKTDAGYKGKVKTDQGEVDYTSVKVDGNDVSLALPFGDGSVTIAASYKEKNKLTGKWKFFDNSEAEVATGDWVATKQVEKEAAAPSVAGEWELDMTMGEIERTYGLRIASEGDGLKGVLVHPSKGDLDCDSVTFEDGAFDLKITREVQGNDVQFIYKGKLSEDGALSGTVVPEGYEDQFSGEWTGKRK